MSARLQHEGRVLGRFIIGAQPPGALVDRYAQAHAHLPLEPRAGSDRALVDAAISHAWMLGALDAACALRRPHCTLRRKVIVMCAIVEASPEGAHLFMPKGRAGVLVLLRTLLRAGWAASWRLAIGLPLLAVIGRRRAGEDRAAPAQPAAGGAA